MAQKRIGQLPPRHSFALNPHREMRCTKCPRCEGQTHLRKFALLIGVEDYGLMVLGKTCRYCPPCDFIIAHQDELEALLAAGFSTHEPEVLGKDYYVIGTVERKTWRRGLSDQVTSTDELLRHAADFAKEFDLHYEPGGRYPADRETR
ncbi:MAG TPA: hypothetical protein VJ715_02040 [Pyrinomonadaceae bacterium]|nr:hypothetical protein [Pyrinomonadaceae bacterium]